MSTSISRTVGCWICIVGVMPAQAEPPTATAAIARGLEFVQTDAVKWRKEHECATCHHGAMTVWALSEAKSRRDKIVAETFAENLKWTKDRFLAKIDQPRDTRPGHLMVNSAVLNLAVMACCVPEQEALSADERERVISYLLRHQEADGSWAWSSAPAENRPPPFFESDEVATLLGIAALYRRLPNDANEKSEVRIARDKATEWLKKTTPTDTTQAAAYKLLVTVVANESAEKRQHEIDGLLSRQNKDGGWAQLREIESDAYATGQSLYVLNHAGLPKDHECVLRGVRFLVATQNEDGSWPMKRRGHPGVTPSDFNPPIIYFGSVWGTLGLIRSVAE